MVHEFMTRSGTEDRATGSPLPADAESTFHELALSLFALQFDQIESYRKFCLARGTTPGDVTHWHDVPAIPTSAFKDYELSSLSQTERTIVFQSSGTTTQRPSRHFHSRDSLVLYEASLLPWLQRHILPERNLSGGIERITREPGWPLVILTPRSDLAPHSSLVHMFETARQKFGSKDSRFVGSVTADGLWSLNFSEATEVLRHSVLQSRPIILMGTAFLFVHLLEHLQSRRLTYRLPPGSRVLETGGYKGRSRALPKAELHRWIAHGLGIPVSHVVCEYGMSELSSQAYDGLAGFAAPPATPGIRSVGRLFRFPPWARARVISPETGGEVRDGETGLLRVFDLANVHSIAAIQTEDLGVRHDEGFELMGRAESVETRGCSLMTA